MKNLNILLFSLTLVLFCCEKKPRYYAVIHGKIENPVADSMVFSKSGIKKTIKLNADGTFRDTIKAPEKGSGLLSNGRTGTSLYLDNGYEVEINADARDFLNTVEFKGKGFEASAYQAEYTKRIRKKGNDFELYSLPKDSFDISMKAFKEELETLLYSTKNVDSTFFAQGEKRTKRLFEKMYETYNELHAPELLNGNPSPKFVDYENYAGGTLSLDDLKGKYVYIDLWATWCKPCIGEIPHLKKLEKEYHGKNIEFVSISIDRKGKGGKWRTFVKENNLTGIQLWSRGNGDFLKAFYVKGIPKFILLDPDGVVLETEAPRPSDTKLKDLFNSLNL
ncbi:redoxin family protein [Flavivirga abyssicola]|uniref:TlpA family protein disulfide reductase n=1 Tax=Flavivirga abyssicola TaxID=3063533 RepID=UPI0026DF3783|nr:redoxin family protein [Flavivirga sp. MEBiC07777]WVK12734.1 redoxin family protein [Flavivirga sp. MEBiC07777]